MTPPASDLESTVEQIRKSNYPGLPADLVREILTIEIECLQNRTQAARRIAAAIDSSLGR